MKGSFLALGLVLALACTLPCHAQGYCPTCPGGVSYGSAPPAVFGAQQAPFAYSGGCSGSTAAYAYGGFSPFQQGYGYGGFAPYGYTNGYAPLSGYGGAQAYAPVSYVAGNAFSPAAYGYGCQPGFTLPAYYQPQGAQASFDYRRYGPLGRLRSEVYGGFQSYPGGYALLP